MDQQSGKQRKIMERETIISLKEIQTAYLHTSYIYI